MIQSSIALMTFIIAAFSSWYEGSAILEVSWEWKHTAIFSEMINGPVTQASDILPIDYFVYAAKFFPTFPFIMLLSVLYLLILIGYILLKRNDKIFSYFTTSIGLLFLVLSSFVSNSPTIGLKILFISFLFIGMISIAIVLIRTYINKTKEMY